MITRLRSATRKQAKKLLFRPPSHLARNHLTISSEAIQQLRTSITENCHANWRVGIPPEVREKDLNQHLYERLDKDRRIVIPWLDHIRPLNSTRVLEVGCGTGSSSIALAEQGAKVTGIDVGDGGLAVARKRMDLYGLSATFLNMNATAILDEFGSNSFEIVIFFASLEHMPLSERIDALNRAWQVLSPAGILAVVETPNRLWYFDGHTSRLPFFHWLPDELAFYYSQFSERENFRERYRELSDGSMMHFLRQGRGVSFHDFEIAISPIQGIRVVSSFSEFHGIRHKLTRSRAQRRYMSFLASLCPGIDRAFFEEYLDLALKKT